MVTKNKFFIFPARLAPLAPVLLGYYVGRNVTGPHCNFMNWLKVNVITLMTEFAL